MGRTETDRKITKRAVVVDAEVKENQQKTTHRSEWRSALKKDLTGPTLLEMSGNPTYQALTDEAAPHDILPSDVGTKISKRAACLVLLIPLVLFEMYLCTAFLPMRWQRAINDNLSALSPKSHELTPITHPLLNEEIESVLHQHVGLRITLFAITVALLLGNAWLIRRIWQFSIKPQASFENR